jgi:hypothetical protein
VGKLQNFGRFGELAAVATQVVLEKPLVPVCFQIAAT